MKKLFAFVLFAAFAISPTFANDYVTDPEPPSIVGVAVGNEDFSTLVAAVKAADLVDVLSGDGPFTVFAPTNDAFAKLPDGTIPSLLKPESKETLTAVLTSHVVKGKFMAADVLAAIEKNDGSFTIPTVQGGELVASLKDGKVILTDAAGNMSTVVLTDVPASNGVIHAIDSVVMPK
ncbi:MAG: fasciclin domain-containing protein [Bacteroidota bacterium]